MEYWPNARGAFYSTDRDLFLENLRLSANGEGPFTNTIPIALGNVIRLTDSPGSANADTYNTTVIRLQAAGYVLGKTLIRFATIHDPSTLRLEIDRDADGTVDAVVAPSAIETLQP